MKINWVVSKVEKFIEKYFADARFSAAAFFAFSTVKLH